METEGFDYTNSTTNPFRPGATVADAGFVKEGFQICGALKSSLLTTPSFRQKSRPRKFQSILA